MNYTDHPTELLAQAVVWLRSGRRLALATLVNIDGNAPYPIGSQMLIAQDGDYLGQLTGGCAERAIADQAVHVIQKGENRTLRYGLDSPFFDIQLPCGSGIDVYFDCQQTEASLGHVLSQLQARQAVQVQIGEHTKVYLPTPRLLVFGQGPIMLSLSQLALASGYDVVCCVQDEATRQRLESEGLVTNSLGDGAEIVHQADQFSALVSLFHEHDLETPILQQALETPVFYIGALGSKRTHEARLISLQACGVKPSLLAKIHGPVGINIAAKTPSQIAISILAQVIAEMNRVHW